jgi:hypothetical protein
MRFIWAVGKHNFTFTDSQKIEIVNEIDGRLDLEHRHPEVKYVVRDLFHLDGLTTGTPEFTAKVKA